MADSNIQWKQVVRERLLPLGVTAEREIEIIEEYAGHLEGVYEDAVTGGASHEEALALALLEIPSETQAPVAEAGEAWSPGAASLVPGGRAAAVRGSGKRKWRAIIPGSLWQDLRYALRLLRARPGFTLVTVITLALGIGANVAVFSVLYSALLGPLPYERPDELALIWCQFQKMGASRAPASGAILRGIQEQSSMLQDLAGIWVGNGTLTDADEPEQIKLASVTPNFFSVLGARPLVGRTFEKNDQVIRGHVSIVISYGLWQRHFGADPTVVGRQVPFQQGSATVVGVMPQDFQLLFPPDANVPLDTQAWIPFTEDIYALPTDLYYIRLLGRLKTGATWTQAQADLDAVAQRLRQQFPEFASENLKLEAVGLRGDAVRDLRPALLALFAGALMVLLIACVNVANLLLSHAGARRKEIAVRLALGASRWRIVRQLLCESLLLWSLGAVAGVCLGLWGVRALLAFRPDSLNRLGSVSLNWQVLVFIAGLSLLTGLLFGLAPALEVRKVALSESLKGPGRTVVGRARGRLRQALVLGEVALGLLLLLGAGLMTRTLAAIHQVDPGFRTDHVLTFELNLSGRNYSSDQQRALFVDQWEEKLRSMNGVEAVGAVSHLPLDDYPNWYSPYAPEGLTGDQKKSLLADYRAVTPGYFQAIGANLLAGRYLSGTDEADSGNVVVVDELLARQTWPAGTAVGKRIEVEHFVEGEFKNVWAEVVGVVGHIRHHSLTKQLRSQIYIPFTQSARPHLSYVVRTTGDPLAIVSGIRRGLKEMDDHLALSKVRPLQDYVDRDMASADFTTALASIFGLLALVLAAVGIYGVLSYGVVQRLHEIGLRMALGAGRGNILRMVIREGMTTPLAGMGVGLVAAFWLTRFLSNLLFGVSAYDPRTFILVPLLLGGVALLACYIPARRATRVDPLEVLRRE